MNQDLVWQQTVNELLGRPLVTDGKREFHRTQGWVVQFDVCPLVSVRRTAWKTALAELEWLIYGGKCHVWWERWKDTRGCVPGVPVLMDAVEAWMGGVASNPTSRRNVLVAWPEGTRVCPYNDFVAQATVDGGHLDLFVFQRTCNAATGMNHFWLQMWALGTWCASRARLRLRTLRWVAGDVHLYREHEDVCRRAANEYVYSGGPSLAYTPKDDHFRTTDFVLDGQYAPQNQETLEAV